MNPSSCRYVYNSTFYFSVDFWTKEKLRLTENAQPAILTTSIAILRVLEVRWHLYFDYFHSPSSADILFLSHLVPKSTSGWVWLWRRKGVHLRAWPLLGRVHRSRRYQILVPPRCRQARGTVSLPATLFLVRVCIRSLIPKKKKKKKMYSSQRLRGESMTRAVADKGVSTSMSALVVNGDHLAQLEDAMDEIKASLPPGELVELANINSVNCINYSTVGTWITMVILIWILIWYFFILFYFLGYIIILVYWPQSFQVVISGTSKGVDHASRVLQSKQFAARAVDLPVSWGFTVLRSCFFIVALDYNSHALNYLMPSIP